MIAFLVRELEEIFRWLLAASWQAAVLALLVLLVQRVAGGRLNPRWRYALWLLVLLRLVLPVLPESALSLFQFAPPPPAAFVAPLTEPWQPVSSDKPYASSAAVAPPVVSNYPFSCFTLLTFIWLAGAVILLVLTWQVNRRFARQVAKSPAITDPGLWRLFAESKAELGIRRAIRLIENSQVHSPAIMGLFQPTLLLPADVRERFDARELRLIFLHELAHLKRGDVAVQALIAILQILHWFNPVLWFAFRRMRIDREPATDALVLSRAGEQEKDRYGLMLVKLLEHFNQHHSLPTLVGILEDKDQFKRRFSLIARFTRGAYGWSLLGILLTGILSVACLTKSKALDKQTTSAIEGERSSVGSTSRPAVDFNIILVEIDEKTYEQNAQAMDDAVRKGNLDFFENRRDGSRITRKTDLILNVGQSGYYTEGQAKGYISSACREKQGGKFHTVFTSKLIFYGLNADFAWSKKRTALSSVWSVTLPVGVDPLVLGSDIPPADIPRPLLFPRVHVVSFTDKDWDMAPGKDHGFWVGKTYSLKKLWDSNRVFSDDEILKILKAQSEVRLAVFMSARPTMVSNSSGADSSASVDAADVVPARGANVPAVGDIIGGKDSEVTLKGYVRLKKPETVDLNKAVGYLTSVDGGGMEFHFRPDGSFALRHVKPGVYLRHILFVGAKRGSLAVQSVDMPLSPIVIDDTARTMTMNLSLDVPFNGASRGQIEIGLKVLEVSDDVYLAKKAKIDKAIENDDIGLFNNLEGVDLLSAPSVATQPGVRANIKIVREFPYPTSFENGEIVRDSSDKIILSVPPTPREFATKDIGVSAEITPTIDDGNSPDHGKIVLNGKFTVTDLVGFTKSNLVALTPSFNTSESFFLEALDDHQEKGLWIPGGRSDEETITNKDNSGKVLSVKNQTVNKRLLLFVSANLVK